MTLRSCGRRFASEQEACRSKRALSGAAVPKLCSLTRDHWHLETVRKPKSPKRKSGANAFPKRVAGRIDRRDGCCQRCGSSRNLHRHHRRGKGSGGSQRRPHAQCACNGIVLCFYCHMWAHGKGRREAEAQGFIVSQAVDEPGSVGVMRFAEAGSGVTQWPTCGGEWAGTAAEALEAVA